MPVNDSIFTMTPGSAVAATLQEILARKRELSRQAMLDKLAADEQSSVIAARQAQTELGRTQEERLGRATAAEIAANEASTASAKENLFQSKLKNLPRGKKPSDEGTLEELRKRGLMEAAPIYGPPSEAQPEGSSFEGYVGTPEEQQRAELMSLFDEAIGQSEDPNAQAGLKILKAGGPAIPFYFGPQDTNLFDPDTKKTTTLKGIRPGSVEVLPRKPQLPAGYLAKPYTITDISGKVLGTVSLEPGEQKQWEKDNPDKMLRSGSYKETEPKTGISTSDISLLAGAYQQYDTAQRTYDNSYGDFGRGLSEKAAAAKNTYERVLGGVAAKVGIESGTLDAANFIAHDPELSKLPTDAAVIHPKFQAEFNTPELEDMEELNKALLLFRGAIGQ